MKLNKRVLSLIMAVVMVLSLCTVAFATDSTTTTYDVPATSTTVTETPGIASITINGTSADFMYDNNTGTTTSSKIYARATVAGTEYNLKTATVVVTTTGTAPAMYLGETEIPNPTPVGNAYTYQLDMFNNAYEIEISDRVYVVAAGLVEADTPVALPENDPLRIDAMTIGGATGAITMNVVQNLFMGNPYYDMWTSVSYKVKAAMSGTPTRSALAASINVPTGTSVSHAGCVDRAITGNGTAQDCILNLTSNTTLTTTYGDYSRNYYIVATDANNISVKVGIDFTEAVASNAYKTDTDVKGRVDTLINQCKIFFGNKGVAVTDEKKLAELPTHGEITVPAGTTAMGIMRMFAVKYEYGSEVPENCTYMAKLNGVGEFTFGSYSGWMYSDNPTWTSTGAADFEKWRTPAVGGADYVLTEGSNICWFICCNYMHHPWQ